MIRQHPLVKHPVGRLSAAARWYLAGIAMLALILIAIHFAIQVYAQQEAKRLVSSWVGKTGISVSDVRYRMLRGALTLVDVRLSSERLQAHAPTVFLHGNLSSLSGKQPQATRIEIRKAHLRLTAAALKAWMKEEDSALAFFHQLLGSAQYVGIYDSRLDLLPAGGDPFPGKPTGIDIIRLESQNGPDESRVRAMARCLDGKVELTNHIRSGRVSDGNIVWKGIDLAAFLEHLPGLSALPGRLSGRLAWQPKKADKASYRVMGKADLKDGNEGDSSLTWDGFLTEGVWQGDVTSTAWPLAMFSGQLPEFQQHRLTAGRFDGAFKLAGNLNRWQIDMTGAELSAVRYRRFSSDAEEFPDWHAEKLHIANAHLQWPERRISARAIELANADFVVDSRGVASADSAWKIEVKEIALNNITSGIRLSEGVFYLPVLEGRGSWQGSGRLQLKLASSGPDKEKLTESWSISGDGMPAAGNGSRFRLDVHAKRAALVRFRPLMPEMIRRNASAISGEVDLQLQILAGASPWEASGEATVTDASLQYGGEQWHTGTMKIGFDKIGAALPQQLIRQIDVQGWHYQAALRPLNQPESHLKQMNDSEATEGSVADANAEPWHVQKLVLRNGVVTVGNVDAVWVQNINAHIEGLQPGSVASIKAKAKLGEGRLTISGTLSWHAPMPEFHTARITVRDALPFFMNEWLAVSGMPQLIRGRLYADISLQKRKNGIYEGLAYFRLQHGALGPTLSQNDPLLSRVGFHSHDLFASLQRGGRLRLRVPLQGQGDLSDLLGNSLMKALQAEMEEKEQTIKPADDAAGDLLSSVRLHEKGDLSHNERTRLRRIVRYMREHPKRAIELKPQLSLQVQEDKQTERARYTQGLIETFLVQRGIPHARIFPVWPSEQHRSPGSTSGIAIVLIP